MPCHQGLCAAHARAACCKRCRVLACPAFHRERQSGPRALTGVSIRKLDLQRMAQHRRAVQRADCRLCLSHRAIADKAVAAERRTESAGTGSGLYGTKARRGWAQLWGPSLRCHTLHLHGRTLATATNPKQRLPCSPQAVLGHRVPHKPEAGQHAKLAKHRCDLVLAPLQRQAPAGSGREQAVLVTGERWGRWPRQPRAGERL